jgi:hypothetical protein
LVFRTIQAGPNVTIDEIGSGLRISASTTSVTVTGGTVSGGIGSNPFITGASNFYTLIPDEIILENSTNAAVVYSFTVAEAGFIYYALASDDDFYLKLDNDSIGTFDSKTLAGHGPALSLSGYIASGRAVYLGGGSGSSSSTSGMSFDNFTGGLNIETSGDSSLMSIYTPYTLSGSGYVFDASGVIGTGDSFPFVVSKSGQVGLNLYTGDNQVTGYVTPYQLHVSGVTALSGSQDLNFATKPALTVIGSAELEGSLSGQRADFTSLYVSGNHVNTGAMTFGDTTTAQRNAMGTTSYNKIIYNSTAEELQLYRSSHDAWVKIETGVAGN